MDAKILKDEKTGRFLKGSVSPGKPVQSRNAIRYITATQRGCSEAEWEEIVKAAVKDAKEGGVTARCNARSFLARILIPPDPAAYLQIFHPEHTLNELKGLLKEYERLREETFKIQPKDTKFEAVSESERG